MRSGEFSYQIGVSLEARGRFRPDSAFKGCLVCPLPPFNDPFGRCFRGETQRDRLHESARKRSKADRRGDRENRSEAEQTEANKNANTALWTTVSGFESLPPSQRTLNPRTTYERSESGCRAWSDTARHAVHDEHQIRRVAARCARYQGTIRPMFVPTGLEVEALEMVDEDRQFRNARRAARWSLTSSMWQARAKVPVYPRTGQCAE